jgi:hypothetical protein
MCKSCPTGGEEDGRWKTEDRRTRRTSRRRVSNIHNSRTVPAQLTPPASPLLVLFLELPIESEKGEHVLRIASIPGAAGYGHAYFSPQVLYRGPA